jgi:anti-sigma factor RsiW
MTEQTTPIGCKEIRGLLPAFLADEISASESRQVQDHLDRCPLCRKFQSFEGAFDGALKRTLQPEAAPASLVVRVHRALDEEDAGHFVRLRRTLAQPWARWALAASILVALLGPGLIGVQTGYITLPISMAGVIQAELGTLVCAECQRGQRSLPQQRGCRAHGHHAAFQADTGQLWEFVDSSMTRPLINDADRIGDRIEVRGLFINDLRYVKVDSYEYLAARGSAQQGL